MSLAEFLNDRACYSELFTGLARLVDCDFFSSRRRHTRLQGDWSSDVCSSDLLTLRFASPQFVVRNGVPRRQIQRAGDSLRCRPARQSKGLVDGVNGWTLRITDVAAREIRRIRIRTLNAIDGHPPYAQSPKDRS